MTLKQWYEWLLFIFLPSVNSSTAFAALSQLIAMSTQTLASAHNLMISIFSPVMPASSSYADNAAEPTIEIDAPGFSHDLENGFVGSQCAARHGKAVLFSPKESKTSGAALGACCLPCLQKGRVCTAENVHSRSQRWEPREDETSALHGVLNSHASMIMIGRVLLTSFFERDNANGRGWAARKEVAVCMVTVSQRPEDGRALHVISASTPL